MLAAHRRRPNRPLWDLERSRPGTGPWSSSGRAPVVDGLGQTPSRSGLGVSPEGRQNPVRAHSGLRPEVAHYEGAAEHLQDVWVAVRASLRTVLERVNLDDVVTGRLPRNVAKMTEDPDAWAPRR